MLDAQLQYTQTPSTSCFCHVILTVQKYEIYILYNKTNVLWCTQLENLCNSCFFVPFRSNKPRKMDIFFTVNDKKKSARSKAINQSINLRFQSCGSQLILTKKYEDSSDAHLTLCV